MSQAEPTLAETSRLSESLLNGTLSPEEGARLEEMVIDSEPCRLLYLRMMRLHGGIARVVSSGASGLTSDVSAAITERAENSFTSRLAQAWSVAYRVISNYSALSMLLSGIIITIVLLSMALWEVPRSEQNAPGIGPSTEFVARIANTSQAAFDESSNGNFKNRDLFDDDKVVFHSGLVVVEYDSGVRVVLEGPATYHVQGANGGNLQRGKLVARIETKEAQGFALDIPGGRIVDLGTEFGVEVAADGDAEVAVLTGAVELTARAGTTGLEQSVRLSAGQAASLEAAGGNIIRRGEADPRLVARFRKLADDDLTPPIAVALRNLSVHYRADNVDGQGTPGDVSTTRLVNLASPGTHDGTIVGGSGVTRNQSRAGSPYEYGVVLTAAQQTHIEVNSFQLAGGTNKVVAATWEFWVRADSALADGRGVLYGEYPAATTGAAGDTTRHFIRMNGIGGAARQVSYDEYPPSGGTAISDSGAFETATFQQLVVVKQADALAFYLNGAPLGGSKANAETYSGDKITRTLLGVRGKHNESFDGQFNIIRIYDRALGPAEVRANYEAENSVRQTED